MRYPLVSVIIPTYNYARFILFAIRSVLDQTYPIDSIEIIVIDDGSTDNTKDILNELILENKIQYYFQNNAGKANATASGIKKAKGKYFFNLDADDLFLPEKISRTVKIFEEDASIVHVATPAKRLDELSQIVHDYEVFPPAIINKTLNGIWLLNFFLDNNMLYGGGSTYSARVDILKKLVIPSEVDMYIDEFLIYAILPFGNSYFIDEALSVWRGHGFNYSEAAKTADQKKKKGIRLLDSSMGILKYLKANSFEKNVIDTYELKYYTALLAFKEKFNEKSLIDIYRYFVHIFFQLNLSITKMKKYFVFNRLIPMFIFKLIKGSSK
jgi:glycosyltransferase involved in cell wall biosynthesis